MVIYLDLVGDIDDDDDEYYGAEIDGIGDDWSESESGEDDENMHLDENESEIDENENEGESQQAHNTQKCSRHNIS